MGRVWLVGAGPGDPELITWRGVQVLRRADVVLYDALSHPDLLDLCPQAELRDVGKRYGQRATPQSEINAQLLELAAHGKKVVRLKGGDPFLFARGSEEAWALAEAGIPFEIVPGVTSPVAASAFAGIALTHRDLSSSVTFITGSDREGKEWSKQAWTKLATATDTICIFMGMRRIDEITQALIEGGRSPDTPAAVVRWGARPRQRTVEGTLSNIAGLAQSAQLSSPAIIIVGEVVELRKKLRWYDNRPLFGKRVLLPRPLHQAKESARLVRERGATPLLVPALQIGPPADLGPLRMAVAEAFRYDWVIFTSANGVAAFFAEVRALDRDARVFGRARIAVIGEKTAQALQTYGLRADLVATRFVAESLVEDLLAVQPAPSQVLIPRAREARELLPEELRARGIHVDVVPAYVTHPVQGESAARLLSALESEVDVALFTSSSMVHSVVAALGKDATLLLSRVTIVSIGPVTSETLRQYGLTPQVEAQVYTVDGALDALEAHLAS